MTENRFKKELAQIPYSVTVVTVGFGGTENGLTISWLSQVSMDPPLLMFSIDKTHFSTELLEDMPHFVVNVLGDDQVDMAAHFATMSTTAKRKIDAYATQESEHGLAILSDALAYFECDVVERHEAGDHWIVIGQITNAGVLHEGRPLTTDHGLRYTK